MRCGRQTNADIRNHLLADQLMSEHRVLSFKPPVCTEKLNPSVAVMKSAEEGVGTYNAGSLNRPRDRRIFV